MRLLSEVTWWILVFVISLPPTTNGSSSLRERLQRNPKTPPRIGKEPLNVNIGVYIESLGKFQAAEMSFDVDLYLYSSWRDPSLNHSNSDYVLISDYKVKDHIWMPDLYFSNARTSKFHDVTVPNFSLFIAQDGTVAYSSRVTLTVACNLNLVHYPMDQQTCTIRTLSYAHVASEVNVTWFLESPIRYNPGIGLPEFVIADIHHAYCDGTYMYAIMDKSYKIDRFSCLEGIIHLRRSIGYHVVQSFIPTGLIVMISWVSFWIDRRAVPARVTLSFTTLLSLSTLGNGLRFGLPQVSYAKSIDLWFGACMFFVFASLL
ncbi:Protein LGC-41 a, partial [Aphelenchoides avenae]